MLRRPKGTFIRPARQEAVAPEEFHSGPELTRDQVGPIAPGDLGKLGEAGPVGAGVAQHAGGPERPDLDVRADVRSHLQQAVIDQAAVRETPEIALAHPASGAKPGWKREKAQETPRGGLRARGIGGIVLASVARAEQQLALGPSILVEERPPRWIGVAGRALRVSLADHERGRHGRRPRHKGSPARATTRPASLVVDREVHLDCDGGVDGDAQVGGDGNPEVADVDPGRAMDAVLTRLHLLHPVVDGAGLGDAMEGQRARCVGFLRCSQGRQARRGSSRRRAPPQGSASRRGIRAGADSSG